MIRKNKLYKIKKIVKRRSTGILYQPSFLGDDDGLPPTIPLISDDYCLREIKYREPSRSWWKTKPTKKVWERTGEVWYTDSLDNCDILSHDDAVWEAKYLKKPSQARYCFTSDDVNFEGGFHSKDDVLRAIKSYLEEDRYDIGGGIYHVKPDDILVGEMKNYNDFLKEYDQ